MTVTTSFWPIYRDDQWLLVDITEPGSGCLTLGHWSEHGQASRVMAGPELATLLSEVRRARTELEAPHPRALKDVQLHHSDLRSVHEALEAAFVLAVAGIERYRRLYPDRDDRDDAAAMAPLPPLCVDCSEGAWGYQDVTISARCSEQGHRPFGHADPDWDHAQDHHANALRWWRRRWVDQPQPSTGGGTTDPGTTGAS